MPRVQRVAQPVREWRGWRLGQPVYCESIYDDEVIGACYVREFRPKKEQIVVIKQTPEKQALCITVTSESLRELTKEERIAQIHAGKPMVFR